MNIDISYSPADAHTAEQMQIDLSQAALRLENPMLLVLVTPDSVKDETVLSDIAKAQQAGKIIAPVILRQSNLPDSIQGEDALNLSKNYDKKKLVAFINRRDITKERSAKNRRLFLYVGGVAILMFVISIISISRGIVAFPVDEYATENAIRDAQIATLVAPDMEVLRPRTTEDALNFQSTLDAIENEDLLPFVIGTATAIPEQLLATNEARLTQVSGTESAQTQVAGD